MPALLRQLELAGCIVTADALHCQKNIAKEVIESDAALATLTQVGQKPRPAGDPPLLAERAAGMVR